MGPALPVQQRDLNFKVLKFLGKGSYGSVFQVQRLSDGQQYALKEMDVRAMNQAEREDAANEIRLLASVACPNVISYNEAFLDGNRLCIIMEYAPDGDLAKVIKKHQVMKRPLPEDLIWKFFIQVARGLQALHNMKILHRDIKPGNIMVMSGDIAKIGDLGISKLLKHTMAKTQIGTPHYMPPEVWKNRPYAFTSDTWAMGCILYEMATFSVPFEAKSMSELRYKVLRGSYPPLSSGYSRELHQMVKDCMDQNPDKRPTMDKILNSEAVLKRLNLLPTEARAAPPSTAASVMLNTIKVPKNLQLLKGKLPGPVYPGMEMPSLAEDEEDEAYYPPVVQQQQQQQQAVQQPRLPQIGGGGGGGIPVPAHMQGKNGAIKSVYQIAQNYGLPLPMMKQPGVQQQRAGADADAQEALFYGKPKAPAVQTNAMRDQQQRVAVPAPMWPPQPAKGVNSESHAYGAFYGGGGAPRGGPIQSSYQYQGPPAAAPAAAVKGTPPGLPAIGSAAPREGGGGWVAPPWNFAAAKAARAAVGGPRNGGGGYGGPPAVAAGAPKYPPQQWPAPKPQRW